MKKKIAYTIITTALMTSAFFVGKYTTQTQQESKTQTVTTSTSNANDWWRDYCDSEVTITDWNTDGNELALSLSNGIELYATKSETVYNPERKNYITFENISDVSKEDGTISITDIDGNEYTINTKGE